MKGHKVWRIFITSNNWIEIEAERHQAYDQILAYHPALEPLIRLLDLARGRVIWSKSPKTKWNAD